MLPNFVGLSPNFVAKGGIPKCEININSEKLDNSQQKYLFA